MMSMDQRIRKIEDRAWLNMLAILVNFGFFIVIFIILERNDIS